MDEFESVFGMSIRYEIKPNKPFACRHNNIAKKNIGIRSESSVNELVKSFSQ